ncbi:general secretion pathway protein GspD [Stenotrophomonas terrae]|uniref:General secretion pathway protein GspD n=1 Tax=Stenotrophomonas terrae TaxID=405446 RepID=A0A0R0CYU5_9GAMM|nr:type II secretion system secretin GspD [Stenotrophomonas terrae]KRG71319.1 general secretion pathway protein GspD [Stenotrophomonas terrae]
MITFPVRIALHRFMLLATLLLAPLAISAAPASDSPQQWSINMKDTDIRDFIGAVANITGDTLIIDPRVVGEVSVSTQEPMSLPEVRRLFLSVMTIHGFAVIEEDTQTRVVPNDEAHVFADGRGRGPDAIETRVLTVQHSVATELLPMLRPLVPANAHLAAVPTSNSLIISDRRGNIARIEALLRQLDAPKLHGHADYEVQFASVENLQKLLQASLGATSAGSATKVLADTRTNRLLIFGPEQARQRLLELARSLDVDAPRSTTTQVIRLQHGDAKQMAQTLGAIGDSIKQEGDDKQTQTGTLIRADESLNAVVIHAKPEMLQVLTDIVRQLDIPRSQVLVEAAIVEISGDIEDALGVQWALDGGSRSNGVGGVNYNNTGLSIGTLLSSLAAGTTPTSLPSGAILGIGNSNFGALVTALSTNSKNNLLSTPTLLTLDHEPAEILVGQNVPFQTGSYTTTGDGTSNPFTTIQRQDIGVTLKVTPHINQGGTLRLEIEQEISSLAATPSGITLSDVITNKRSIKSTILANDGQVIVLGGLIQDDVTHTRASVPLLGSIPGLGRLFSSTSDTRVKRNLMVFLRPTVILGQSAASDMSERKYLDLRQTPSARGKYANPLPPSPEQLFDRSQGASERDGARTPDR